MTTQNQTRLLKIPADSDSKQIHSQANAYRKPDVRFANPIEEQLTGARAAQISTPVQFVFFLCSGWFASNNSNIAIYRYH